MPPRVALTGATGFIGSVLAQKLVSRGWQVQALVRPISFHKRPNTIPIKWIPGDLDNPESLRSLVQGAEAVVHCAGAVRGCSQRDFNRINVDGVLRLANTATEQSPSTRFLLISSLAAREPHLSHYAASKRKGEKALAAFSDKMLWGVLRPSAVYGPGDRELLPLFQWMARGVAPVIGSDGNRFSLLHVRDLTEAVICWLDQGKRPSGLYELHDGHVEGYTWEDVINTAAKITQKAIYSIKIPIFLLRLLSVLNQTTARLSGRAPMLTPGKVRELIHPDWVADNSALTGDTKWAPKVTLEAGLRQIIRT